MPRSTSTAPHADVAEFLATFAAKSAAIENAHSGSNSALASDLSIGDGVTVEVSDGVTLSATITVDENAGLPFDYRNDRPGERADFSAERLAEFDADYALSVRQAVFSKIARKQGRWSIDQINDMLAALGLGEVKEVTDVTYEIAGTDHGKIRRTVAGALTLDEAKAKLEESGLARYTDAQLRADAAFGTDGSNKSETRSFDTMRVTVRNEWPAAPSAE